MRLYIFYNEEVLLETVPLVELLAFVWFEEYVEFVKLLELELAGLLIVELLLGKNCLQLIMMKSPLFPFIVYKN